MGRDKKSKTVTAILALFFGFFGIHRFYLGQRGYGVIYILLSFGLIGFLGIIDFFVFMGMSNAEFDRKYNSEDELPDFRRRRKRVVRDRHAPKEGRVRNNSRGSVRSRKRNEFVPAIKRSGLQGTKLKALIQSGKKHYEEFDFFEAIAQWERALEVSPKNAAIHYNLACAYSLTEQAKSAFSHLSQAIKFGFSDFDKMKKQDALAFLRIQPEYENFAASGFQVSTETEGEKEPSENPKSILSNPNLLEQLKELGELRDKGLLTNEEFIAEKKKLL